MPIERKLCNTCRPASLTTFIWWVPFPTVETNAQSRISRMVPPSKNRGVPSRSPQHQQKPTEGPCPCVSRPSSDGICDLDVWLGTTVDADAAQSGRRMLRPNLPVVKSKKWTVFRFPGHLYRLVSMNWALLISVFVGAYVGIVGLFALLLAACHGLNQDSPGIAKNFFNLSLQTLSTTGYGALHPANNCSNWISVVESFSSMLITSFITGIAFVKFARPHPNIVFSEVFAVSQGENGLEVRFRVANETRRDLARKGDIIDVSFKLILMRVETGRYGEPKLCYYDLKLATTRLISLRLEVELVHAINANSPLFKQTSDDLVHSDFVFVLLASGQDENLHDMIHAKREYGYQEIKWGAKFQPMLNWDEHHKFIELDMDKISTVVSAPINSKENYSIDVELLKSPKEEVEELGAASFSPSSADNRSDYSSRQFQTEDTIPHKLSDGSLWELRDDHNEEAIVQSTNQSQQRHRKLAGMNPSPDYDLERGAASAKHETSNSRPVSYQGHSHQLTSDIEDRPMSLLQRRVRVRNRSRSLLMNGMYQRALSASWPGLLLSLIVAYMAVIATIALLISVSIHEPLEERAHDRFSAKYQEVFFFCVQTVSTVGYGALSPRQDSNAANFFVFLLVLSGLFVSTLLTGITWAKFSIPKASTLLYSDVLLLTTFHSQRAIMFRAANNRKYGILVEGSFRMSIVMLNRNFGRRETHELRLARNVWPIISLCNTVTHIIDERSPLYNFSTSDLLSGDHFFVVLFTGLDNIISDTMVARKAYHACDILVDHHFENNITLTADGLNIDLDAISATYCQSDMDNQKSEEEGHANSNNSPHGNYERMSDDNYM